MAKTPKPFTLILTPPEAAELLKPSGEGGHQQLHEMLREQLANDNLKIQITDAQLGKVIRYMTQYGSGGFQGRLQRAFRRPLSALIAAQ